MPKPFIFILLLIFAFGINFPLFAQSKKDSIQYKKDLKFLTAGLMVFHPGIQTKSDSLGLKQAYKRLGKRISSTTTAVEFKQTLGELVKLVKDGHTGFTLGEPDDLRILPFQIAFSGEIYFVKNSKFEKIKNGSILTHIGSWDIDSVYQFYRSYLSIGDQNYDFESGVRHTKYLQYVNLLNLNDSLIDITYLLNDSTKHSMVPVYSLESYDELFGSRSRKRKAFSWKFLNDSVALLSIRSFNSGYYNSRISRAIKEIKDSTDVQSIVLDLRQNAGGQTSKAMELLGHFIDTTWALHNESLIKGACLNVLPENTYIDRYLRKRIKKHGKEDWVVVKNEGGLMESSLIWGEAKPKENIYNVKDLDLVVLIDEGSFSAAAIAAARLQDLGVILIGVPSMCRVRTMNMGVMKEFELPNTQLSYRVPLIHGEFNLMERKSGQLVPNIIVHPEISDEINGKDRILERALQYLREMK